MERLSVLIIGCSLAAGCTSVKQDVNENRRPSIIFILTDDHRWDAMGYAGITKTILEIAGAEIPKEYQGISLMPYVRNKKPVRVRKEILFEHLWKLPEIPSSEGIRTDKWKYFRYRFIEAPEELYDLVNDSLETNNLAQDPVFNSILNKLRKECDAQIKKYTKAKLVSDYTPPEEIDKTF